MSTSSPLRELRPRLVLRLRFNFRLKIFPQNKSKIFLLCWCPDTAAIKKKMLYSSSFDTLKKAFVGVHKVRRGCELAGSYQDCYQVLQANGHDDVEMSEVEKILRATDRN